MFDNIIQSRLRYDFNFSVYFVALFFYLFSFYACAKTDIKKDSQSLPLLKFPYARVDSVNSYSELEAVYSVNEKVFLNKPLLSTEKAVFILFKQYYTEEERRNLKENIDSIPLEDLGLNEDDQEYRVDAYLNDKGQIVKKEIYDKESGVSISNGRVGYRKIDCQDNGRVSQSFFETPYTGEIAVLIRDKESKEVFYAEVANINGILTTQAGECSKELKIKSLRSLYEDNREAVYEGVKKLIAQEQDRIVRRIVRKSVLFGEEKVYFKVADVESKSFEYPGMEEAFQLAKEAYANYREVGVNRESVDKLEKAIVVWEDLLKESDLNDKNAKVNLKVTRALHNNLRMAYALMLDYEKALYHERKASQLKNMNQTSFETQFLNLQMAYNKNINWGKSGIDKVQELYKESQSNSPVSILNLGEGKFSSLIEIAANYSQKNTIVAGGEDVPKSSVGGGIASQVTYSPFEGHMIYMYGGYGSDWPQYQSLPEDICVLTHLKNITITSNEISKLPGCITKLVALETLNLKNNKLQEFPVEITKLVSLEKLDLSGNDISSIPDDIGNMKNLKKLVLKNTKISKSQVKSLKGILPKKCKVKF